MQYRILAASLGQLGRAAEASDALNRLLAAAPLALDAYVRKRAGWYRPEDHAHLVDGFRKAGWKG